MELLDLIERQENTVEIDNGNSKRWKMRYRILIITFLTCILILEVLKSLRQMLYDVRN